MAGCIGKAGIILQFASIALLFSGAQSKCNGTCVPLGQCSTTFAGEGLFDVRVGEYNNCSHYLAVCCSEKDIIEEKFGFKKHREQNNTFQSCGMRNENGVGFRVVDGSEGITQFGEFPWMVALLEVKTNGTGIGDGRWYFCGGSLIEPNVVVTVAHCLSKKGKTDFIVRAGEWDAKTRKEVLPYQERRVDKIVIHESYNKTSLYNDIALLFLEEPFQPDANVQLLCLPPQGKPFDHQKNCIATGWGKYSFDMLGYATLLKKIPLPIVTHSECQTALRSTRLGQDFQLHDSFLCAGGAEDVDTCTGDGGSPLVCPSAGEDGNNRYELAGMVID